MTERITLDEYQEWTDSTAVEYATSSGDVDREEALVYLCLALNGEAGEVAEKAKRVRRGDGDIDEIGDELADTLWYLCRIAEETDTHLSVAMERNVEKLEDRKARDVIKGSGDDR